MINNYEEYLNNEIHKNEVIRTTIIAVLIFAFFVGFATITSLARDIFLNDFESTDSIYIAAIILFFFTLREFIIRILLKKKYNLPLLRPNFRYINILIEISVLSIMFFVLINSAKTLAVLNSPIVIIYFLIILSTTLTVDFRISLFAGIVAAAEYLILIFYAFSIELIRGPVISMLYDFRFYFAPVILMIFAGIFAGITGSQLRKRIIATLRSIEEKNKIRNLFGQQVSQEIVDELTEGDENLESKKLFVCVMFLDIRDFTKFAENRDPKEIIKFQNNVFGFMIDAIIKNKGVINQFLGDGYMATFGIPFSKGNDVQNAVDASLEILETLEKKIETGDLPPIRIGIGLHAGNVVAGNVGTEQRKQYSISGETVIIASRIEQLNKKFGSQFLISSEVFEKINSSILSFENLGPLQVKGRKKPVSVLKFEALNR